MTMSLSRSIIVQMELKTIEEVKWYHGLRYVGK